MMNLAYEVIKGRVPMIGGVGAIRTEDCIVLKTLWIDTSDRELESGIA